VHRERGQDRRLAFSDTPLKPLGDRAAGVLSGRVDTSFVHGSILTPPLGDRVPWHDSGTDHRWAQAASSGRKRTWA
jgi:hypothetical protein